MIMSTLYLFLRKTILAVLVLAAGLAAIPSSGASAAGFQDQPTPSENWPVNNERLERIWTREQALYQRHTNRLARADEFISRAQSLIDKAAGKGWDTTGIQAALDAFAAAIPAAQAAHDPGQVIISSHAGFDANGAVADRTAAVETARALGQVLKNTRLAMNGTGQVLRVAVGAFRETHRPSQSPSIP
jgi:hypothetical protein